jgi:hypothetical protein
MNIRSNTTKDAFIYERYTTNNNGHCTICIVYVSAEFGRKFMISTGYSVFRYTERIKFIHRVLESTDYVPRPMSTRRMKVRNYDI